MFGAVVLLMYIVARNDTQCFILILAAGVNMLMGLYFETCPYSIFATPNEYSTLKTPKCWADLGIVDNQIPSRRCRGLALSWKRNMIGKGS
jgi:hypothetical protein